MTLARERESALALEQAKRHASGPGHTLAGHRLGDLYGTGAARVDLDVHLDGFARCDAALERSTVSTPDNSWKVLMVALAFETGSVVRGKDPNSVPLTGSATTIRPSNRYLAAAAQVKLSLMTTSPVRPMALFAWILLVTGFVLSCGGESGGTDDPSSVDAGAPTPDAEVAGDGLRGARYCEVLLVFVKAAGVEAQVWGTQGLSACPADAWNALDAETLRTERGAVQVVMNGPRYWLIDSAEAQMLPDVAPRMFGDLEMRQLATVQVEPSMLSEMAAYTPRVVNRTTRFTFRAGAEIYELLSADGSVYAMQSYATFVDPSVAEGDLAALGERLHLPAGWQYRVRVLDADLDVRATGEAVVVQDELANTYQRYVP